MSRAETVRRYLAERFGGVRFIALAAALVAVGAFATGGVREAGSMPLLRAFIGAYCAILAFRIWDDLEDRDTDAATHPDRINVRGDATALASLGIFAALIVIASLTSAARLAGFAALGIALLGWYRLRARTRPPVVDALVLMLKYPAIALIVAPRSHDAASAMRALPVLIVLYLLLCTIEWFDDPRLHRRSPSTVRGPLP